VDGGVLIFDGECGFCTWTARWAERRLPPGARTEPWQRIPDLAAYGLTVEQVKEAAYWIDRAGRAHRGHLGVAEALREMGPGWRVASTLMTIPPVSWLGALVYEVVSRNRSHLPGTTPACHLPAGRTR
jgi:predicted DCC family thiol-disulfide oxidoreductase YuxK